MTSFSSLSELDEDIALTAIKAEQWLERDPAFSLFQMRLWLEHVLNFLEDYHAIPHLQKGEVPTGQGENQYRIGRLRNFGVSISESEVDRLHEVRFHSNQAVHVRRRKRSAGDADREGAARIHASNAVKEADEIARWLEREYCGRKSHVYSDRAHFSEPPSAGGLQREQPFVRRNGTADYAVRTRDIEYEGRVVVNRPISTRTPVGGTVFGGLVLFALILYWMMKDTSPTVTKAPITIADILEEFGLNGRFAVDCARRPSESNKNWRFVFHEPLPFIYEDGPSNEYSGHQDTFVVMQAKKLSEDQIALSLGRPNVPIVLRYVVLLVDGSRFRSWMDDLIVRGARGGVQSPWLRRC